MLNPTIDFMAKGVQYSIPNTWESLTPYLFRSLIHDISLMAQGKLSIAMVRVNYVCRVMGWQLKKIKDSDGLANLTWLAEQVTFPFTIVYPDNDAALQDLDFETRKLCKRIPPHRLTGITIARYLSKQPYNYAVDSCFCKQQIPAIRIDDDELYSAYNIDTSFNRLTCSLTALQFIEARSLIGGSLDQLPLLAAILYYPEQYSSDGAHALAHKFVNLPTDELTAIAFNFQAFVNYLFTKTEFKLPTEAKNTKESAISTGALESLYNLSSDGLGDVYTVERMNILQYLTILRKKLIDTVRSLHSAKMEKIDIANETGLPIYIINDIL
jgi:hypothetical protein